MTDGRAERAGQPAQPQDLVDVAHLVTAYYTTWPDLSDPGQRVVFGTSGHRGSSLNGAFNEAHIVATTQAICDYRTAQGIAGPLFIGRDTHGLSEPAWASALEVLAANDVTVLIDSRDRYTPTPAVSHAILVHNRGKAPDDASPRRRHRRHAVAQPAVGRRLQVQPAARRPRGHRRHRLDREPGERAARGRRRATSSGCRWPGRWPRTRRRPTTSSPTYVDDLPSVLDLDAVREAGIRIGADPLGGASVDYWGEIAERHRLDLTVVNPLVDPTWRFMTLDWDGKIRMDCSSPFAMASLIANKDEYEIATGNDADADRHGIVTPDAGLLNPNHYLAVAIEYLYEHRDGWRPDAAVGKTLVSSSMIDRVAEELGRRLLEVPVGFKWFVPGLLDGSVGFGGEESAGASFLRKDGSVWTTDKDGILLALLASEIQAVTGRVPERALPRSSTERHGDPAYARVDAPADREQKAVLAKLSPEQVKATELAGEPIVATLTAGARQRRRDRRAQGRHGERVVRRPAVGHRGRLQDLRGVVPGSGAPGPGAGRRPRARHGGSRRRRRVTTGEEASRTVPAGMNRADRPWLPPDRLRRRVGTPFGAVARSAPQPLHPRGRRPRPGDGREDRARGSVVARRPGGEGWRDSADRRLPDGEPGEGPACRTALDERCPPTAALGSPGEPDAARARAAPGPASAVHGGVPTRAVRALGSAGRPRTRRDAALDRRALAADLEAEPLRLTLVAAVGSEPGSRTARSCSVGRRWVAATGRSPATPTSASTPCSTLCPGCPSRSPSRRSGAAPMPAHAPADARRRRP